MNDPTPRSHYSIRCKIAAIGLFLVLLFGIAQGTPGPTEIDDQPHLYGRAR